MQSVTADSLCPRLRWTCLESQVVTRGQSATWPVSISPLVTWWWQHHLYLQGPWGFRWSTVWEFTALSPRWFSTLWFLRVTAEDGDLLPVNTMSVYRASWSAQGLGGLPGRHLLGQCSLGSKDQVNCLHLTYPSHVKTTRLETRINSQRFKKTMAGATGAFVTARGATQAHPLRKTGAVGT